MLPPGRAPAPALHDADGAVSVDAGLSTAVCNFVASGHQSRRPRSASGEPGTRRGTKDREIRAKTLDPHALSCPCRSERVRSRREPSFGRGVRCASMGGDDASGLGGRCTATRDREVRGKPGRWERLRGVYDCRRLVLPATSMDPDTRVREPRGRASMPVRCRPCRRVELVLARRWCAARASLSLQCLTRPAGRGDGAVSRRLLGGRCPAGGTWSVVARVGLGWCR